MIGGKNIKEIEFEELMKLMSIVFQKVYLFHDTIENNIKFYSNSQILRIHCKNSHYRGIFLKDYIEERAVEVAYYIIETKATVRQAAKKFGISKSTVHKDCTERLRQIDAGLAAQAREVLDVNKSERHIRGGVATREKYRHLHELQEHHI